MSARILIAGFIGAFFAAANAYADNPAGPDSVVAAVAGVKIKAGEIQTLLATLNPAERQAVMSNVENLTALVRRRAEEIAVVKEAERRNWQNNPAVMTQIREARDAVVASTFLQSVGKPQGGYPSEKDIRAAFEQNKAQLVKPPQYELQQLFVERPANADETAIGRLRKFVMELEKRVRQKGADFPKFAETAKGPIPVVYRNLGFAPADRIAAELRAPLTQMNIGDILPVVTLPNGYALLRLHDFRPAVPLGYAEAHDRLADTLRRQKTIDNQKNAVKAILERTPVTIDSAALGTLK